jgi:hypothetical protein
MRTRWTSEPVPLVHPDNRRSAGSPASKIPSRLCLLVSVAEVMGLIGPQDEIVLDDSIKDMNEFLDKLNKFEKITNSRLVDLWQIKDTAFQPLRASIDVEEYMPGLFDMLNPNKDNELSKVMSVFAFLQVETFNLKNEIETKYYDTLILFGESGLVYEEVSEDKMAGEQEI